MSKAIPVIDLFAGPGGLGEGFSSVVTEARGRAFKILLSVEKDKTAHKTLELRAFFRAFPFGEVPQDYYKYLRGEITRDKLFEKHPKQAREAREEAQHMTLGVDNVTSLVGERLNGAEKWVLIGGPPCQAYSLVGRSRMSGKGIQRKNESVEDHEKRIKEQRSEFATDHRHKLYREYLTIIADHWPTAFVMENVKGILSSKLEGSRIFPKIRSDLENPWESLSRKGKGQYSYNLFSLVVPSSERPDGFKDRDFLIKSEDYGIPQARHRVIILGIRSDKCPEALPVLEQESPEGVQDMLHDLPSLTSGLSKEKNVFIGDAISSVLKEKWWPSVRENQTNRKVAIRMENTIKKMRRTEKRKPGDDEWEQIKERDWFYDPNLKTICNHETRSHIRQDLWRYLYCACYASVYGSSPHLKDFPKPLLPKHRNVEEARKGQKFGDRFRCQTKDGPSTTVTSHISKDGHYFIHYDQVQCRSFSVREAARLQTFPDNYFFEGPRTEQYHQVGNAVPPFLARQIGKLIQALMS